MHNVDKIY